MPTPIQITLLRASHVLEVRFEDGESFRMPAEYLRVNSPSAEVQGHGPGQKVLVDGKADVNIDEIVPVGRQAAQVVVQGLDLRGPGVIGLLQAKSIPDSRFPIPDSRFPILYSPLPAFITIPRRRHHRRRHRMIRHHRHHRCCRMKSRAGSRTN